MDAKRKRRQWKAAEKPSVSRDRRQKSMSQVSGFRAARRAVKIQG